LGQPGIKQESLLGRLEIAKDYFWGNLALNKNHFGGDLGSPKIMGQRDNKQKSCWGQLGFCIYLLYILFLIVYYVIVFIIYVSPFRFQPMVPTLGIPSAPLLAADGATPEQLLIREFLCHCMRPYTYYSMPVTTGNDDPPHTPTPLIINPWTLNINPGTFNLTH